MDAWADLHLSDVAQRQAEYRADAARERRALITAPRATVDTPAATRRERLGLGRTPSRSCADCPAGQPA